MKKDFKTKMDKTDYLKLVDRLNALSLCYHQSGFSEISDTEYDQLYRNLIEFEESNPQDIASFSPSQRVGEKMENGLGKFEHPRPMLSLDKLLR